MPDFTVPPQQMLACLTIAVQAAPNPPKRITFLCGDAVVEDLGIYEDICCDGTAFVRVDTIEPSTNFPDPDVTASPCQPQAWALRMEVGLLRCMPTGDQDAGPTVADWEAMQGQMMIDTASLFGAACCFTKYQVENQLKAFTGGWRVLGPQGGCMLTSITVIADVF